MKALWKNHSAFLVFHMDLLPFDERIADRLIGVQINASKPDAGDLAILIGGVVIDALACVAAAGVESLFVKLAHFYTALLLGNRTEDMKDLADAGRLTAF